MSGPQPDEPNYFVLIAPGADSNDPTPAWTDVSTDLRSVSIRRGADKHLDEDQPGEATIVLDNFEGTYDNDNTASPYFGQLITDMRARVLAEWDGELYERFNGYLDDIDLEYPDGDAEAWAVLRCTDAFKVLAGTTLPVSVYAAEVAADSPVAWWRLGAPAYVLTAGDEVGTRNLTYVDNPRGGEPLVSRDPNGSTLFDHPAEGSGNVVEAAGTIPFTAFPFTIEAVFRSQKQADSLFRILTNFADNSGGSAGRWVEVAIRDTTTGNPGQLHLAMTDDAGATGSITVGASRVDDGRVHHVAIVVDSATFATIYLDGADDTSFDSTKSVALPSGTVQLALGNAPANYPVGGEFGLDGELQDVAVYDYALSAGRIAAHADAVSTPWNNDTPAGRANRIRDLIGWPALLRDFDTGESTFQSADLGQTALDHLLKVAASEFGELHVSKEGAIQLRARHSLINRDPLAELGPDADQIRYRAIRFASGADLVRNPVTVSRSEGVAQTAEAAAAYYPHQFTLEGLFHDSDTLSRSAAEFLLAEFKDQKRRISGITFGPFDAERLFDWFPLLLEAELGDVYQVTFRPPNGDDLVQVSVLEGTVESWSADSGVGEIGWSLSRAYAGGGAFWQLGIVGRSELGVTTRLYF